MFSEGTPAWNGLFYKRGSVDFPRQIPTPETFKKKIPEHVCTGNCNRFDIGEAVWGDSWSDNKIRRSFDDLSGEVKQFLISVTALRLSKDLEVTRAIWLMQEP